MARQSKRVSRNVFTERLTLSGPLTLPSFEQSSWGSEGQSLAKGLQLEAGFLTITLLSPFRPTASHVLRLGVVLFGLHMHRHVWQAALINMVLSCWNPQDSYHIPLFVLFFKDSLIFPHVHCILAKFSPIFSRLYDLSKCIICPPHLATLLKTAIWSLMKIAPNHIYTSYITSYII